MKIFKYFNLENSIYLLCVIVFTFTQAYLTLKVPDYMSDITVLIQNGTGNISLFMAAGRNMLICAALSLLAMLLARFFAAMMGSKFSKRVRSAIFEKIQSFSKQEMDSFSTASLITRSTNDVTQVQNFLSGSITQLISAPVTFFVALFKIVGHSAQWTIFTFSCTMLVVATLIFIIIYAHPRQRRIQSLTDELNKSLRESLTGVRVIRAYNAEEYQNKKFEKANDNLITNSLQARIAMSSMNPVMKFVNNFLNVGIYFIGAYLISNAGTSQQLVLFSEMVVFSTYASKIVRSFMMLNRVFMILPNFIVSSERINEVLEKDIAIKDGKEEKGVAGQEGTVEFKNVSFHYPDSPENSLSNINFKAEKGQTVAFIGATGSGKSTLVNLVERFYDATEGEVLVNGRNVKEYKQHSLHEIIGYTAQKAILFTGSIKSNLLFGLEEEQDVSKALEVAQIKDFVDSLDNKEESFISRGGSNVSGGQRQRLSIARTIQRRPEIFIFDDTFSALDYKTDKALRAALKEYCQGVTTLIVSQRIGTIKDADKIIVLDEGTIVGQGTHEQLLKECDVYASIAYTQLSKEELANG